MGYSFYHTCGFACFLTLAIWTSAADLDGIAKQIKEMEARHQAEMQALREEYTEQLKAIDIAHDNQVRDLVRRLNVLEDERELIDGITTPQASALAKSREMDERLMRLETGLSIHQNQQEMLTSQLDDRLELHLYTSLEFQSIDKQASSFDLRNVAIVASAELTDRLHMMSIVELEPASTGGYEVEVDQAWVEYRIEDWFSPRFGVVLVPFGRFNMYHFDILNDLSSRPIVMRQVIPVSWAEPGVGIVGSILLDDIGFEQSGIDYEFFIINGLSNDITDTGTRGANVHANQDNNSNKAVVGRLGLRLAPDQEIGFSGYHGKYDNSGYITGFDVDWRFRYRAFELLGEFAYFGIDKGLEADGITEMPRRMHGGYVQANYHFWLDGLNECFLGEFESPTFTAIVRYDEATIGDDGDLGTGENHESRLTLGLNYRPVETWAMKLEYQFNETKREPIEHGDADGLIFSVSTSF